jgi:predicted Zn-dependent peptidase
VAGSALLGTTAVAQAQSLAGDAFHRARLDNGLEVVVVENHAAPVATVLVAVRGGADQQAKGEEGMAHLMEHLTFRSYGRRPGDFDSAVGDLNGMKQGFTGTEVVAYYLVLPADRSEKGIGLLSKLIRDIDFDNDDIEAEQAVVLDELERRQVDPEYALARQVERALWGASWHRRDVGGDSLSLQRVTGGRIADAYSRCYVANNAVLIVSGDVTFAQVLEAAARHFGDWTRGRDATGIRNLGSIQPLGQSRVLTIVGYVSDVTIRMAFRGPSFGTDPSATTAARVFVGLINETDSALQEHLVATGLFHSLQGSFFPTGGIGTIEIVGKTSAALAPDALESLLYEIDVLHELQGVSDEQLRAAKKGREVDAAIAGEAAAVLAPQLASLWAGAGLDYYVTASERADSLDIEALRRFAGDYIAGQPLVVGVLGPGDAIASVRALFEGGS